MKDIKLREVGEKTIKTVDRAADLAEHLKEEIVRTADRTTADEQVTPNEYSSDMLQEGMEDIATEAGHIVVSLGKGVYRTGKSAIQKYRKKQKIEAEQQWQEWENDTQEAPEDEHADPVAPNEDGPTDSTQPPIEEEKTSSYHDQQGRTGTSKASAGDRPNERTKQTKDRVTGFQKAYNDSTNKDTRPSERTIKQPSNISKRTAKDTERAVKGTGKGVKVANHSPKIASKTAQDASCAVQMSVKSAAQSAERMGSANQTVTKATEGVLKFARTVASSVKAMVSASGITLPVAGGAVVVIVIVMIMLVALITASPFGVFFSGEETTSSVAMQSAIQELNRDYGKVLLEIQDSTQFDKVQYAGAYAPWSEILAVYSVRIGTEQDTATMDEEKRELLEEIFWDMNQIKYRVETVEEIIIVETLNEYGQIVGAEIPQIVTTLYIDLFRKTASAMASQYGFNDEQKQWLNELLNSNYTSMWRSVIYGQHDSAEMLVAVAESQLGNKGGFPYWYSYGFTKRVEWCACFVSWCARECGYIEAGLMPRFSVCDRGMEWFKERDQWLDGSVTPAPGMIIFYDWDDPGEEPGPQDGISDHVGIVEKVEGGYIYTIEGNYADSCVRKKYRIGWYEILGFGWIQN